MGFAVMNALNDVGPVSTGQAESPVRVYYASALGQKAKHSLVHHRLALLQ